LWLYKRADVTIKECIYTNTDRDEFLDLDFEFLHPKADIRGLRAGDPLSRAGYTGSVQMGNEVHSVIVKTAELTGPLAVYDASYAFHNIAIYVTSKCSVGHESQRGNRDASDHGVEDNSTREDFDHFHCNVIMELLKASCHHGMRSFFGCGVACDRLFFYMVGDMSHGDILADVLDINCPPLWEQRLQWLVDITTAVSYLHSKGFLHGNLRSLNIWTKFEDNSEQTRAVIDIPYIISQLHRNADTQPGWQRTLQNPATLPWLAPELLKQYIPVEQGMSESAINTSFHPPVQRTGSETVVTNGLQQISARSGRIIDESVPLSPSLLMAPLPEVSEISVPRKRALPEDVYAISMIAYECLTLSKPWSYEQARKRRLSNMGLNGQSRSRAPVPSDSSRFMFRYLQRKVVRGRRPNIPESKAAKAPERFVKTMQACWRQDPSNRPSIENLLRRLTNIRGGVITATPLALAKPIGDGPAHES